MEVTEKYCEHEPTTVTKNEATILQEILIQIDKETNANRLNIVVNDKKERTYIPREGNMSIKMTEIQKI